MWSCFTDKFRLGKAIPAALFVSSDLTVILPRFHNHPKDVPIPLGLCGGSIVNLSPSNNLLQQQLFVVELSRSTMSRITEQLNGLVEPVFEQIKRVG